MRLDIARIDERIKKLQEIKRIASDPEMTSMLFDCLVGDESPAPVQFPEPRREAESRTPALAAEAPAVADGAGEADALIKSVLGGAHWNRKVR